MSSHLEKGLSIQKVIFPQQKRRREETGQRKKKESKGGTWEVQPQAAIQKPKPLEKRHGGSRIKKFSRLGQDGGKTFGKVRRGGKHCV